MCLGDIGGICFFSIYPRPPSRVLRGPGVPYVPLFQWILWTFEDGYCFSSSNSHVWMDVLGSREAKSQFQLLGVLTYTLTPNPWVFHLALCSFPHPSPPRFIFLVESLDVGTCGFLGIPCIRFPTYCASGSWNDKLSTEVPPNSESQQLRYGTVHAAKHKVRTTVCSSCFV